MSPSGSKFHKKIKQNKKKTVAWIHKRTISTERPLRIPYGCNLGFLDRAYLWHILARFLCKLFTYCQTSSKLSYRYGYPKCLKPGCLPGILLREWTKYLERIKMLKDQESTVLLYRSTACSTFNPLNINTHTTTFRVYNILLPCINTNKIQASPLLL
jgi:hypothetical protein